MTFAIVLMLFAILLRLYGAVVLPILLGIVAIIIALFVKEPNSAPEQSDDEELQETEPTFDTSLDIGAEQQYEYDVKADKYF